MNKRIFKGGLLIKSIADRLYLFNYSIIFLQSKVPMSEALLEDMILSLDIDYDNNLDYKELAKGLSFWKKERRENRRKQISRESTMDSFKSRSSKLRDIFKELATQLQ